MSSHNIPEIERVFHDHWARNFEPSLVLVDQSFKLPSCPENLFIAQKLSDLQGKTVLELGTGLGEAAVFFAKCGAQVVATDVSGKMLQMAQKVAELHGVRVNVIQMDGARLALPDNSVDIVYGANVLHHVDTELCLQEVRRVLKPAGHAAFWDPIRYNPFINIYRRMAHQVRSADEHPLGRDELILMQNLFSDVKIQFSWFLTLVVFFQFYFIDQIHPNEERYWKKVIYHFDDIAKIYNPLRAIDRVLLRLPGFRWMAWNMTVVLEK